MSVGDEEFYAPCPECRRHGNAHLVLCWVEDHVLEEEGVSEPSEIPFRRLYELCDKGLGVDFDGVCGDCGSDYVRDENGNIID